MTGPKRYSLADVRRSYGEEKAWRELTGALPAALLYRPVSFPLSALALRLGVPVAFVTWSGLAIAVSLPLAAVSGMPHAYAWVAVLGVCFHVLDCVDGNMARTTGRVTRFGAVLDGFVDVTFFSALFAALGLLVEHEAAVRWSHMGLEVGLCAGLAVLINRTVRDHYAQLAGRAAVLGEAPSERPTAGQWVLYAVAGLEHLYAPALGIAGMLGAVWALLLLAAAYAAVISCAAIWLTLRAAQRDDVACATPASALPASTERAQH